MYSVILMAAMTTNTAEAPAWLRGGHGCYGALILHSGRYGGCTGCWGADFGGCWGSGYGVYGAGCYGCMGCYGGWYGYGGYVTPPPGYMPGGNYLTTPATPPASGTAPASPGTGTPPATPGTGTPPMGKIGSSGSAARLVIEKPADARLYVDNIPIAADVPSKTFITPELDPSQAYYYMVRVEMTRDGKPLSETRRVIVRAGETVTELFRDPTAMSTASLKMPLAK
jgi:uncharacterized protein (TIGR03000 family)